MSVLRLDSPIRPYAWGSDTALATLQGRSAPTPGPEAELWLGAHPDDPSRLADGTSLTDRIAADPAGQLGAATVAELGPRLPFLLKVLAADRPLSLQVHPTLAQARAGYAAERAAGVAANAANYTDDNHKPELICALRPFRGLAGFRPLAATRALLAALAVPELDFLAAALERPAGLRELVGELLGLGPDRCTPLVAALGTAARAGADFPTERTALAQLAAAYPTDPGVLVALLLNVVTLQPGQALFLPAGVPHAYLGGVGVEIMASSDNVLRGGLTSKRIDVPELLAVLDTQPAAPAVLTGVDTAAGVLTYPTPAREFELSRLTGRHELSGGAAQLVLAIEGPTTLRRGDARVELAPGTAAFLAAAGGPTELAAPGAAYRATVNLSAAGVP